MTLLLLGTADPEEEPQQEGELSSEGGASEKICNPFQKQKG